MTSHMMTPRDINKVRRYDRDGFAKAIRKSTRTLDRFRAVGKVPPPDEVDETGHPVWFESTVVETLLRRQQG